jgi:hypothetical protein
MARIQRVILLILAIGLATWAMADVALAQRTDVSRGIGGVGGGFQYVIKFACGFAGGFLNGAGAFQEEMAPGLYYTDVNIHNPNDQIIKFRKKIALDGAEPQHHGAQTSPIDVILGPDEALEINCTDIIELLARAGAINFVTIIIAPGLSVSAETVQAQGFPGIEFFFNFIKGFVVLYSRVRLDVTAVYTACPSGPFGLSVSSADTVTSAGDLFFLRGCGSDGKEVPPGTGISTIQVDELIPPSPVAPPAVFINGLSVSSSGLEVSVRPFSRFAYEGARLMVYDQSGRQLHDSGYVAGTELKWRTLAVGGRPLANGIYFYVVTVKDVLGQESHKVGKFAVMR